MHRTALSGIALLLAAGVALAGCGSGTSGQASAASEAKATPTAPPSSGPFKPKDWQPRLKKLTAAVVPAGCMAMHPASHECAAWLHSADETAHAMDQALTGALNASRYPQSAEQIRRVIIPEYRKYDDAECEGDSAADAPDSDCGLAAVHVVIGVLHLSEAVDHDQ